jgi:ribokinase
MPVEGDRSMVTVDPGVRASAADVAALDPRAVALSLDQLYCVPPGAAAYVTCGDDDARAFARRPPAQLAVARGLFVSKREALTLTESANVDAAAEVLGRSAERVIVTLGAEGAMALVEGRSMRAAAISADALDTTGAGDLLVAAYIWADLRGASPEECLQWAVIYAGLSIARPTGVGGAVTEARLLEEGTQRGLTAPRGATA